MRRAAWAVLMWVQTEAEARALERAGRSSAPSGTATALWLKTDWADHCGVRTPRLATSQSGVALRLPPHSIWRLFVFETDQVFAPSIEARRDALYTHARRRRQVKLR